ncbi:MAG: hypothetical protein OEZ59_03025 [Deltaproteobacteria bacterium]|nr:hypothetical protein [Deltaproteobacteria bacterium]
MGTRISRREAIANLFKGAARLFFKVGAAGAVLSGGPFVHTSHSAGRLVITTWEHWSPAANSLLQRLARAWGRRNGVDVNIHLVSSLGSREIQAISAQQRAGIGFDIISLPTWETALYEHSLESLDNEAAFLAGKYGEFSPDVEYCFRINKVWRALPAPTGGNQGFPMVSRLDYFREFAGIDLQQVFPPEKTRDRKLVAEWNHENLLRYAGRLHKAGHSIANPIAATSDSQNWLAPLFMAFGSQPVGPRGDIMIDSAGTRQVLEYMKHLSAFMPGQIFGWDNADNNRWLLSGTGSAIINSPNAWSLARRNKSAVAAQLWHHDMIRGPQGRFRATRPRGWGIWKFSRSKQASRDLLLHLLKHEQQDQLQAASEGIDLPSQPFFAAREAWADISPPRGSLYNYPLRGDEVFMVPGAPAPPAIAARIASRSVIPNMVAKVVRGGRSTAEAIAWASGELEKILLESER